MEELPQPVSGTRIAVIDVREVPVDMRKSGPQAALERMRIHGPSVRAVGHLLPDQLEALRYCGFSSVLTTDEHPPEQWAPSSGERAPALREGESASRPALPLLNRLISRRVS
jgi:uncharacterized protein (DUF934 family)